MKSHNTALNDKFCDNNFLCFINYHFGSVTYYVDEGMLGGCLNTYQFLYQLLTLGPGLVHRRIIVVELGLRNM